MKEVTQPVQGRPEERFPRPVDISEAELETPSIKTVLKLIYNTLSRVLHDPVAMIIGSGFLVLMLWGPHGNLELLKLVVPNWAGPGSDVATRGQLIKGLPWDQEWISWGLGVLFVVGIPCLLIKFVFKQELSDYGLGLPHPERRRLTLVSSIMLFAASLPAFYFGARNAQMQATYPLYRGPFADTQAFLLYEAGYFAFFIIIEFIFRGYLLFGLYQVKDRLSPSTASKSGVITGADGVAGEKGPLVFGYYAIFVSMLSYTAWHLGKPVPELFSTLIWGIAAGTVALFTGSIWPLIFVHWILNVFMDFVIWKHL